MIAVDAAASPELPEWPGDGLLLLFFVVIGGGGEELDEPLFLEGCVGRGVCCFDLDWEDFAVGEELVGGGEVQILGDAEIEIDSGIQMQMMSVGFDGHEVQFFEIVRE